MASTECLNGIRGIKDKAQRSPEKFVSRDIMEKDASINRGKETNLNLNQPSTSLSMQQANIMQLLTQRNQEMEMERA